MSYRLPDGDENILLAAQDGSYRVRCADNEFIRKSAAFDWLAAQIEQYGMSVRPYKAGIGLVAIKYTDAAGERRNSPSAATFLVTVEAAMRGEGELA